MKSDNTACDDTCKAHGEYKYEKYTNNDTKLYKCVAACSEISADFSIYDDGTEQNCVTECRNHLINKYKLFLANLSSSPVG